MKSPIIQAERLHRRVKTFIITCNGIDGYPLTKAVVPGKYRQSLKEIYFCTNTSSKFVTAIKNDQRAGVYFFTRKIIWKGCHLKGNMEIVTDRQTKERFWQKKFKNAYPEKSPNDPDFCLLKFTTISGRFYSWFKPEDFEC